MQFKEPISIVVVGHVDHGKSTFIGRFLYDTKSVTADRIEDVEKTSRDLGRRMEFAYIMDQFREEREANITIDTSQTFFKIDDQPFILIDAPGHKEYLKNMITGATQAQHAILMLDINEGVKDQTDRHSRILKLLGISNPAVMINKMDMVDFSEKVFLQSEEIIRSLLVERGLTPEAIIPISAYNGDNVVNRSEKMPWYKGPTAFDFLKSRIRVVKQAQEGKLQFPVQLIYQLNNERVIMGRIEQGVVSVGQKIAVFPTGQLVEVEKILKYNQKANSAAAGESTAIIVKGDGSIKRGDVLCGTAEMAKPVVQFDLHGFWASDQPISVGQDVVVECCTQSTVCQVSSLYDELTSSSLQQLNGGDVGRIGLKAKDKILLDDSRGNGALSRVVLSRNGQVSGCGVVAQVTQA